MTTLSKSEFVFMSILLFVMKIALSFCAFSFVALVLWRFAAGLDASGVLVIPESLAVAAIVVYLVGLFVFVWINRRSIKDEIMLAS